MMKLALIILSFVFIAGCQKSPVKDLLFPPVNDATVWNDHWIIYGGVDGIFGEDVRTNDIDPVKPLTDYWERKSSDWNMNCSSEHHTGKKCILMRWDGSESNAYDTKSAVNYVGFYLQSKLESRDPNIVGIDISSGGYKYLEFWVKGHLASGVKFEVNSDACSAEFIAESNDLTNLWQCNRIQIDRLEGDPNNTEKIVSMVKFVLKATSETNGGEVYIDDVRYTK
ncbi:MAG: hypothetical protein LBD17_05680 [Endomicrobium sp.]|nr:hypothetical protein [Endomicrobium sp.]